MNAMTRRFLLEHQTKILGGGAPNEARLPLRAVIATAACNLATTTAGSHVGREVSHAGIKGKQPHS